ncbi:MAG: glutathione S-transferase family protein [Burkholderiales bacterium]|nr:glutathione S-transferase family protein [Burkholderiales bacterium]
MLTLYYAQGTCALATHLALEYAGAEYQTVRVDFKSNEQRSPEYLKINPKGRVPALATERGILTETPALLQYVAQSYPQAGLAPLDDPFQMARLNEFNAYMCATVHVAHAHGRRPYRWADDAPAQESMKKKMPQNMAQSFVLIEQGMLQGPWVLGERLSVGDMYLFTIARWLEADGVDIRKLPKVHDHRQRLSQEEIVRRVVDSERA